MRRRRADSHYRAFGESNPGKVRLDNEDHFEVDLPRRIFAVADGMGGHADGELASHLAVMTLLDALREPSRDGATWTGKAGMERAICAAHARVREVNGPRSGSDAMGTTLSALRLDQNGDFVFGNVGDSKSFYSTRRYDTPAVLLLSQEHTLAAELIRRGAPPQLLVDPKARSLTQAIGLGTHVRPRLTEGRLEPGESVIMCTDGITDYVPASHVAETIKTFGHDPEVLVKMLIAMALDGGGGDNCTCVCVHRDK